MSKIRLYVLVFFTVSTLASSVFPQSRIGVIAESGFIISSIDTATKQSELGIADILIATDITGQIVDVERFQEAISKIPPHSELRAMLLRISSTTGKYEEREARIKTYPMVSLNKSRLGIVGPFGLVVKYIDPTTPQPDLKVGDILISTEVTGQLVDVADFKKSIKESPLGTAIRATRIRFNPMTGSLDENQIQLKTYSYPIVVLSKSKTSVNNNNVPVVSSFKKNTPCSTDLTASLDCPLSPCSWCCARCEYQGAQCGTSPCETGKTASRNVYGRCIFNFCA
ncbi:MAG: hypothetical protein ACKVQW_11950 [Pyrinomonadaceae bacterium]